MCNTANFGSLVLELSAVTKWSIKLIPNNKPRLDGLGFDFVFYFTESLLTGKVK